MSIDDDRPVYACRCLNVRLYRKEENQKGSQSLPGASAEYLPLYVGDDGIKIAHNELTLRTRHAVLTDSTSVTGYAQYTLVTCLVCDTATYRVKAEVTPDADSKEGPIIPTEDWAERDTLTSKGGSVDVHVGKGGCIAEEEIRRATSSPSYSQCFSLALPSESHVLSTTPLSIPPQTRLAIPASHSFLPSLPPFLPPPPFTPSHPIFLHLASIATTSSYGARSDSERRIEEFAKQQLAHLEEHEATLKTQLEHLWRPVREGLKKAERERDTKFFPTLQSRHRSMSPGRAPPALGGVGSPIVRNFIPSTYHAPRVSTSSAARHSALSVSLATTFFHHPNARQEANTGQSGSTAPAQRPPLSPSPPPYTSDASSSGSSSGSASKAIISRSLKRNMDASNDIAITYRWYAIEEQEASRRKAREKHKREKENIKANGMEKEVRESNKTAEGPDGGQCTSPSATNSKGEMKSSTTDNKQDSPRKKGGRRKVTFDVEPNVVTIKRNITAETDQARVLENEEDLLFDMDDVDPGAEERKDKNSVVDVPSESHDNITFHEAPERSQRPNRRQNDLKDASLPQSFVALRPSSLPAPSNIRLPIRSRTDERHAKAVPDSVSSSSNTKAREARDINRQSSEEGSSDVVLSPQQKDLLKLVAADTPSHRGLWKQGSDAWKFFDRNAGYSSTAGRSSTIVEEDEEDESLKAPNTNGSKAEHPDSDWRHYRRPDVVGSVPIPMAPISQQKLGGTPSLQPKTSLADRQGILVPPLPAVTEENEGGRGKSAASSRKEVYAERNRVRGMDPGILDFADDDEEGDAGSSEHDDDVDQISTSRSRQHALKIIKARNAVPAEGLWRSLA